MKHYTFKQVGSCVFDNGTQKDFVWVKPQSAGKGEFEQAIEAIRARISGEWDNEQLLKLGPLTPDTLEDIKLILSNTFS